MEGCIKRLAVQGYGQAESGDAAESAESIHQNLFQPNCGLVLFID
jgi:hypothetical protein